MLLIYKKEHKRSCNNYSRITLSSFSEKIPARVVEEINRICDKIEKILRNSQHDLR